MLTDCIHSLKNTALRHLFKSQDGGMIYYNSFKKEQKFQFCMARINITTNESSEKNKFYDFFQ